MKGPASGEGVEDEHDAGDKAPLIRSRLRVCFQRDDIVRDLTRCVSSQNTSEVTLSYYHDKFEVTISETDCVRATFGLTTIINGTV